MKITNKLAGISALAMMMSMTSMLPVSAANDATVLHTADEAPAFMESLGTKDKDQIRYYTENFNPYVVENPENLPEKPKTDHFDLRDVDGKNYVTPVKKQDPFATCWAFGSIAAAESSIAYQLGLDMNTATDEQKAALDFSERHLAWFTGHLLTDYSPFPAQTGEGMYCPAAEELRENENFDHRTYNKLFFNTGGLSSTGTSVYSSYQGPASEADVPYHGDKNAMDALGYLVFIEKEPTEPLKEDYSNLTDFGSFSKFNYANEEELEKILTENGCAKEDGSCRQLLPGNLDWWDGPGVYLAYLSQDHNTVSSADNWSVPEELRFSADFELMQSNMLPSPCMKLDDGSYQFSEVGLNAIKNELLEGKVVTISMAADKSSPDDTSEPVYMNFVDKDGNPTRSKEESAYWCHYTFDQQYDPNAPDSINQVLPTSHVVAIVGYDDNVPKEYFKDPNGTIGGDGAFIVKNSWGTDWGTDGYFYLSYYDQSIDSAETFTFGIAGMDGTEVKPYTASANQMHDLMPCQKYGEMTFDQSTSMANVFTAEFDQVISSVSYTAVTANEEVTYDVYILDEDAENPTDGTLVAHASETYRYSGFQRAELDKPVAVKKGQRYAVVVTAKREDGNYGVGLKYGRNAAFREWGMSYYENKYNEAVKAAELNPPTTPEELAKVRQEATDYYDIADFMKINVVVCGVVNKGESLFRVGDTWTDLADVLAEKNKTEDGKVLDFDNFAIKAYCDNEIVNVKNEVAALQESYKAGDEISCRISAKHVLGDVKVENLEILLDGQPLETFDELKSGETKEITYTHTITEEEAKQGKFTTNVTAYAKINDIRVQLGLLDGLSETALTVEVEKPVFGTPDELANMSKIDYEKKYGVAVTAETAQNTDGTVTVTLTDAVGNVVDTYTIDPGTGIGQNAAGAEVNLPQTGVTSKGAAVATGSALAMIAAGFWMAVRSFRRKKDE